MSSFLFHLWNHTDAGQRSLEDVIGIIGHQLRALGHMAVWDPHNDPRSKDNPVDGNLRFVVGPNQYNVIVEGFTKPIVSLLEKAYTETGARFVCLATEEPTEKGFNHGTQREMVWRQDVFPEAAKYFDAIWHLVPGKRVNEWYGQFAPTEYVELGYAPTFVRRETQRNPPYDVGFYGSATPRRMQLLRKLHRKTGCSIRIMSDFSEQEVRDRALQEAKIVVQIRKFDEMGLVSSSRCNTALSCGRPVVAESHDLTLSKPWDEIVQFSNDEDDFITRVRLMIPRWRDAHHFQFNRFKEKLTPRVCIGEAIARQGLDGVSSAA